MTSTKSISVLFDLYFMDTGNYETELFVVFKNASLVPYLLSHCRITRSFELTHLWGLRLASCELVSRNRWLNNQPLKTHWCQWKIQNWSGLSKTIAVFNGLLKFIKISNDSSIWSESLWMNIKWKKNYQKTIEVNGQKVKHLLVISPDRYPIWFNSMFEFCR